LIISGYQDISKSGMIRENGKYKIGVVKEKKAGTYNAYKLHS